MGKRVQELYLHTNRPCDIYFPRDVWEDEGQRAICFRTKLSEGVTSELFKGIRIRMEWNGIITLCGMHCRAAFYPWRRHSRLFGCGLVDRLRIICKCLYIGLVFKCVFV